MSTEIYSVTPPDNLAPTPIILSAREPAKTDLSTAPRPVGGCYWFDALLGALIGVTGFISLGFQHVLAPNKIGWLLKPTDTPAGWMYDPATYFLGWHYFRHAPWTHPPGLNKTYGMEIGGSIAFSDSLPILAFIFKPFSAWLGTDFQYFGIWILICFVLQGVFGALLASLLFRRITARIVVTAFFVMSPILLERGWTEYPLMAHWLVLWGLYLYLRPGERRIRWAWMVASALAVMSTFYFAPMVLALWFADAVRRGARNVRHIGWLAAEALGMVVSVYCSMRIAGYFCLSVTNATTNDFGKFALNVLAPIDPWKSSAFFKPLPQSPLRVAEGFGYFGLGMLILSAIAGYELLRAGISRKAFLNLLPLIVVLFGLWLFSLSDKPAFGSHVLRDLPNIYLGVGGIFRSSSRMFWPVYYGLWLAAFCLSTRAIGPWRSQLLIALLLIVQLGDLLPMFTDMRQQYAADVVWQPRLNDGFWNTAATKYRNIVFLPTGVRMAYVRVDYWGANHGLTTNMAYLGRSPGPEFFGPYADARHNSLLENHPRKDSFFIFQEEGRFGDIASHLSKEHGIGRIDGYNIVAPYWFADGKPAGPSGLHPGGTPVSELGPVSGQ